MYQHNHSFRFIHFDFAGFSWVTAFVKSACELHGVHFRNSKKNIEAKFTYYTYSWEIQNPIDPWWLWCKFHYCQQSSGNHYIIAIAMHLLNFPGTKMAQPNDQFWEYFLLSNRLNFDGASDLHWSLGCQGLGEYWSMWWPGPTKRISLVYFRGIGRFAQHCVFKVYRGLHTVVYFNEAGARFVLLWRVSL